MDYNTLILIHIASVILLLGIGGGSAFYKFMADRSGNLDVIVHTNKIVVLADWLFTTPSVMVQPITGVMLVDLMGYSYNSLWLLLSICLYVFSVILWFIAVYLQLQMKKLSTQAKNEYRFIGDDYFKLVNYWIVLGVFSFLSMGTIFYLMLFKI